MATTTPNYGWTVPTSTDLVKDGATAIETLGDAIDASMNTALGTKKAGMVLLNTTSFSGVASQAVNSVFSSTYKNYRLVFSDIVGSTTAQNISLRLRKAGTDNSSNIYHRDWMRGAGVTLTGARELATAWVIGSAISTGTNTLIFDILSPNVSTTKTGMIGQFGIGATNDLIIYSAVFSHDLTSSADFDGFNLILDSGTFTGSVSVYGYNN